MIATSHRVVTTMARAGRSPSHCTKSGDTSVAITMVNCRNVAALPRSGAWMMWVKRGFGFVMLGVAEYYFIKMGQLLF